MYLKINGNVNFKTIGELRNYLTDVLKIPYDSLKFVNNKGHTALSTTIVEDFFEQNWGVEPCIGEGFSNAATGTITVTTLRENIAKRLKIPLDSIRICDMNNENVPGMTQVQSFREQW